MVNVSTETLTPIMMPGVQTRLTVEEENELLRVLREANSLSVGVGGAPENDAFEKDFAQFVGCADAVAVSSCTSALELAAVLVGLRSDDEVIMPAHTFVATAVPFARHGVTIRWADIDPDTRVVSAETIAPLRASAAATSPTQSSPYRLSRPNRRKGTPTRASAASPKRSRRFIAATAIAMAR